jgi:hypothetical protein
VPAFTLRVSHNPVPTHLLGTDEHVRWGANSFSDNIWTSFSGAIHTFGPIENDTIKSEPDFGNVALEAEVLHGSDAIQVDASLKAARLDFRCILR